MVTFDGQVVLVTEYFKYLGSIIQIDREIDGNVNHKIKVGWLKWMNMMRVLYDCNILLRP